MTTRDVIEAFRAFLLANYNAALASVNAALPGLSKANVITNDINIEKYKNTVNVFLLFETETYMPCIGGYQKALTVHTYIVYAKNTGNDEVLDYLEALENLVYENPTLQGAVEYVRLVENARYEMQGAPGANSAAAIEVIAELLYQGA